MTWKSSCIIVPNRAGNDTELDLMRSSKTALLGQLKLLPTCKRNNSKLREFYTTSSTNTWMNIINITTFKKPWIIHFQTQIYGAFTFDPEIKISGCTTRRLLCWSIRHLPSTKSPITLIVSPGRTTEKNLQFPNSIKYKIFIRVAYAGINHA